ncbi:MAG TPA: TolC family protein, partial [Bacteroidales bacterium]
SNLKRITAETHYAEYQNLLFQAEQDYRLVNNQLQQEMNVSGNFVPADSTLELYAIEILNSGPDKFYPASSISFYNETFVLRQAELSVERSKLFPEFTGGYFNHQINHIGGFQGIKLGVSFPLWYFPQKSKITEARINLEMAKNDLDYQEFNLTKEIENMKILLDKYFVQISYYRENALHKADLLIQYANQQFKKGEIDYSAYFDNLEMALKIQLDYLETIKSYNQTAIQMESFID